MKFTLIIMIVTCILSVFACNATRKNEPLVVRSPLFKPPAAGITINKNFEVSLNDVPLTDCISIAQDQVNIQISRPFLEHLRTSKPSQWNSEQERLALIRGRSAETLLERMIKSKDASGCTIVQLPVSEDSLSLISSLLNSGQVTIINNETNQKVSRIFVGYQGLRVGPLAGNGFIRYSLKQKSKPFLTINWWRS